jgi:hypothetical protein
MMKRWVTLVLAAALAGCSTLEAPEPLIGHSEVYAPTRLTPGSETAHLDDQQSDPTTLLQDFATARAAASDDQTNAAKAQTLLRSGVEVIRTRCDLYFRRLGTAGRDVRLLDRQLGLIEGALVAALALAETPDATTIAAVPLAGTFLKSTSNNIADGYLFSPDIQRVKGLADRAINLIETEYRTGQSAAATYQDALRGVRMAQDVCTVHGLRYLVDQAVSSGQPLARYDTTTAIAPLGAVNTAVSRLLGGIVVTDETLTLVYWHLQGVAAADGTFACERLPVKSRTAFCDDIPAPKAIDASVRTSLLAQINEVERLYPGKLAASLAALRQLQSRAGFTSIDAASLPPLAPARSSGFVLDIQ